MGKGFVFVLELKKKRKELSSGLKISVNGESVGVVVENNLGYQDLASACGSFWSWMLSVYVKVWIAEGVEGLILC